MDRRTCRFASQRMGVLRRPGNVRMGWAESPGFIASAAHHRLGYPDWTGNIVLVRWMGAGATAPATGRASRGRNAMSPSRKGIILAVLQLAIVASLAAKYAIDRARFPRVWAQTVAYDPDLPIRGRYLSVRLRVDADRVYGGSELAKRHPGNFWGALPDIYLHAQNRHLLASPAATAAGLRGT